jgi:hypothetical protein
MDKIPGSSGQVRHTKNLNFTPQQKPAGEVSQDPSEKVELTGTTNFTPRSHDIADLGARELKAEGGDRSEVASPKTAPHNNAPLQDFGGAFIAGIGSPGKSTAAPRKFDFCNGLGKPSLQAFGSERELARVGTPLQ